MEMTTIDETRPQLWLDVPKSQTFEEWAATGEKLCRTERVLNWWIGDWWAAGHHRYGERAKVAAEGIFGVEFKTLANAASVCRAFETSRRREHLSWSHHETVAALPTDEADALLDRAEAEALPRREMRVEAMKRKVALGLFKAPELPDVDPEFDGYVTIGRSNNREQIASRILMLQAYEEMGVIKIIDTSKIVDIPL